MFTEAFLLILHVSRRSGSLHYNSFSLYNFFLYYYDTYITLNWYATCTFKNWFLRYVRIIICMLNFLVKCHVLFYVFETLLNNTKIHVLFCVKTICGRCCKKLRWTVKYQTRMSLIFYQMLGRLCSHFHSFIVYLIYKLVQNVYNVTSRFLLYRYTPVVYIYVCRWQHPAEICKISSIKNIFCFKYF